MDPLSPLDRMAEILRRKISAESSSSSKFDTTKAKLNAQASPVFQRISTDELMRKVAENIKAIDVNDTGRSKKIMKIFVENVLVWQFGDEILNDAAFSNVVDEVSLAMENSPDVMTIMTAWIAK